MDGMEAYRLKSWLRLVKCNLAWLGRAAEWSVFTYISALTNCLLIIYNNSHLYSWTIWTLVQIIVFLHNFLILSSFLRLFPVIDQAVQVPLFSVAKAPTLLLSISVPAENIRLLHCWSYAYAYLYSTSRWFFINCWTLQSRNKINFSFSGTLSMIISQPSSALLISVYAKAAHSLHESGLLIFLVFHR